MKALAIHVLVIFHRGVEAAAAAAKIPEKIKYLC